MDAKSSFPKAAFVSPFFAAFFVYYQCLGRRRLDTGAILSSSNLAAPVDSEYASLPGARLWFGVLGGAAMASNIEPAGSAAVSCPELNGAGAPSCYRVSVISGSLEVSARLKNADDLELLMKVLDANKSLFTKTEQLATDLVVKVTKTSAKVDRSETRSCAKADRSETNTDRLTEILTP
jgi:hypothetical protein